MTNCTTRRMGDGTVLVIGRTGQLARALARCATDWASYRFVGRPNVDFEQERSLSPAFDLHRPCLVINAGAWTAINAAERQAETAFRVNAEGPLHLARLCRQYGVPLIHFSTNQVFNGKAKAPYAVEDGIGPLNTYGRSKAAGECAIAAEFAHHLIFRLAWVFSEWPGNFLTKLVSRAQSQTTIEMVDDQHATPTYARDVARAIDQVARRCVSGKVRWGTYHLTNGGEASRLTFAQEILRLMTPKLRSEPVLRPIAADRRNTSAPLPRYGVLDTCRTIEQFGIALPAWQDAVARCMQFVLPGNPATEIG